MYVPQGQYTSLFALCTFVLFTLVLFNYCLRESLSTCHPCCPYSNLFLFSLGEYLFNSKIWLSCQSPIPVHCYQPKTGVCLRSGQAQPAITTMTHDWLKGGIYMWPRLDQSPSQDYLSLAVKSWLYILGHSNKTVLVYCLRLPLFKEERSCS